MKMLRNVTDLALFYFPGQSRFLLFPTCTVHCVFDQTGCVVQSIRFVLESANVGLGLVS